MSARLEIFDDADRLGEAVAVEIATKLETASGRLVLGCPAGRTPATAYEAFSRLIERRQLDLSKTHLVLMDEYVEPNGAAWRLCSQDAHYSCRRFAERHIRQAFNSGLAPERRIPASQVYVPDPDDPAAYEKRIERLGGVDLFLLASGTSDGHVAFNPPGTALSQRTHITALAATTRRDNMASFPAFRNFEETPSHGIGVGPGTIAQWSRAAILILIGEQKRAAFRRIVDANRYDPTWPATVVHACANAAIYADRAAAR